MRRINFTNTQVASSETARDINRGVVLNLIRRRQPISRADLARVSGLQRSTVSLISEQLIREKWVVNGPLGRLPRGRRPTVTFQFRAEAFSLTNTPRFSNPNASCASVAGAPCSTAAQSSNFGAITSTLGTSGSNASTDGARTIRFAGKVMF